jgi:hypothetical protein
MNRKGLPNNIVASFIANFFDSRARFLDRLDVDIPHIPQHQATESRIQ